LISPKAIVETLTRHKHKDPKSKIQQILSLYFLIAVPMSIKLINLKHFKGMKKVPFKSSNDQEKKKVRISSASSTTRRD
jgi:hypothetical protein